MKKTKQDLKDYFNDFVDGIDFNAEFDFEKTIKILPNFNRNLTRIIKHPEEIDRILSKRKEFIITVPLENEMNLLKFENGKSYKVIIWNILKEYPSKTNMLLKMSQEGEYIFGGMEGLQVVEKFAKDEIPTGVVIISFSKKEREDINSFCLHENSGVLEYRHISKHGTIISKRNIIISFYEI
jgi:hypothetical protein